MACVTVRAAAVISVTAQPGQAEVTPTLPGLDSVRRLGLDEGLWFRRVALQAVWSMKCADEKQGHQGDGHERG